MRFELSPLGRSSGGRAHVVVVATATLLMGGTASASDDLVLDLGAVPLAMRKVSHGSFVQGAAPTDALHDRDEEPPHPVKLTQDFWIGTYPVTRGQFAKFVADSRYVTEAEKGQSGGSGWDGKGLVQRKDFTWKNPGFTQTDEHPVVLVTFGDAGAFAAWASRRTGKRVRLPTEAEWEFAARGGGASPWFVGSDADKASFGWFKSNAGNGTRPVGQRKANPFGLYDVAGNVYEWCADIYAPYRDGASVDPWVTGAAPGEPERRVLRGGSWLRDSKKARTTARYRNAPGSRNADNGFRVVVTLDEPVNLDLREASMPSSVSAPALPAPTPSSRSGGGTDPSPNAAEPFSWGLLGAAPLAAASAAVAWMLLRRKRSSARAEPSAARSPSGITTRVGEDGFFVRAPLAPPGSRVRYTCVVNGVEVADAVPLSGEETFVYTGAPPTGIQILDVFAAPQASYRSLDRLSHEPREAPPVPRGTQPSQASRTPLVALIETQPDESEATSEPFAGYPSAY
jgi:formylglycine-generating enzyme required for sulfatase activity